MRLTTRPIRLASFALPMWLMSSVALADASQFAWEREIAKRCPSHHVEWLSDGYYDEVLGAYYDSLRPQLSAKARRIANYSHRCTRETIGFTCEWSVNIDAIVKLGLLPDFAAWSCRNVKCEEYGLCEAPRSSS